MEKPNFVCFYNENADMPTIIFVILGWCYSLYDYSVSLYGYSVFFAPDFAVPEKNL